MLLFWSSNASYLFKIVLRDKPLETIQYLCRVGVVALVCATEQIVVSRDVERPQIIGLEDVCASKNDVKRSFEVTNTFSLLLPGECIQLSQRLRLFNQSRIVREMVVFYVVRLVVICIHSIIETQTLELLNEGCLLADFI